MKQMNKAFIITAGAAALFMLSAAALFGPEKAITLFKELVAVFGGAS